MSVSSVLADMRIQAANRPPNWLDERKHCRQLHHDDNHNNNNNLTTCKPPILSSLFRALTTRRQQTRTTTSLESLCLSPIATAPNVCFGDGRLQKQHTVTLITCSQHDLISNQRRRRHRYHHRHRHHAHLCHQHEQRHSLPKLIHDLNDSVLPPKWLGYKLCNECCCLM